jgi:hypothetical protein
MALKRLIHHAAENGYHGIVVTPGEEQAKRYNIGDYVWAISYHPEVKQFRAIDKNGQTLLHESNAEPDQIENFVGKETAKNLLSADVDRHGFQTLSGLDLMTGGEGMKAFYDKKVPNILNSIGKKYGVKTQLHGHMLDTPKMIDVGFGAKAEVGRNQTNLHYFPITEEMRKDVLSNGLPMYRNGGLFQI